MSILSEKEKSGRGEIWKSQSEEKGEKKEVKGEVDVV